MNRYLVFMVFCGIYLFGLSACEPNERRIVAENRSLIDSLANKRIKLMRTELDSICDLEFDARVQIAKDSIMEVRIEEIKKMLGR